MKYLGGKYRSARAISTLILNLADRRRFTYVEPFLGGAAVASLLTPHFSVSLLSDAQPDSIAMWQAVQRGWVPPTVVSEEQYEALRAAEPSALRGFVGFGCSYGGKFFGGYGRQAIAGGKPTTETTLAPGAHRSVMRSAPAIARAYLRCCDYRNVSLPPDAVVYADPPYQATTAYAGLPEFDHEAFWRRADWWHEGGALVVISEINAPRQWVPIWAKDGPAYLRGTQLAGERTDRLFVHADVASKHGLGQTTELEQL